MIGSRRSNHSITPLRKYLSALSFAENQTDYACRSFRRVPSDPGSTPGISTHSRSRCISPGVGQAMLPPCTMVQGGFIVSVLDLVFPRRCVGCGIVGRYFCAACRKGIQCISQNESICPVCGRPAIDGATHPKCRTRYTPDGLISFFRYDGVVRRAVRTLKYRFVSDLGAEFVSLIPEDSIHGVVGSAGEHAVLVPVPLHRARFLDRGFNQSQILGHVLSGRLHLPIRIDMLRRTKKTAPQVEMQKREARLKNMEAVFSVSSGIDLKNTHVVLFDDVCTTGATLRSASGVLKRGGALSVWAVTMAR